MRNSLFRSAPWFPLMVLGLLAALSYWLSQVVQPHKPRLDGSDRHDPDYVIEHFVATRMGADGLPQHVLTADKLLHFPDNDVSELFVARLTQYKPGLPSEHVVAEHALLDKSGKKITFLGGVTLTREASKVKPALRIYTTSLIALPDSKRIMTDAVIVLTEGTTKITAQGMDYDQLTRKVLFKHRVRAQYQKGRN
ncbi:LPS export ABC transporter periplasmic protein LptC [Leeia oryzae]|uniref:LPS export ABC transporter periplasmic protein LptC n=1 Tax=Leeia oryzae TaxID=356662 RepID=UPI0012EA4E05|nr:LPS export ABC transporter periplasmic protein LptC [Leeia oryzae]